MPRRQEKAEGEGGVAPVSFSQSNVLCNGVPMVKEVVSSKLATKNAQGAGAWEISRGDSEDYLRRQSSEDYVYDLFAVEQYDRGSLSKDMGNVSDLAVGNSGFVQWASDMPQFLMDAEDEVTETSSVASSEYDGKSIDYPSTPEPDEEEEYCDDSDEFLHDSFGE